VPHDVCKGQGLRPYLRAHLTVWSVRAIGLVESGKRIELSSGFHFDADMTPGTYESEAYDGVMRALDSDHVACVRQGRYGPDVAINASARLEKT
jgi:hypothetical protein